MVTETIKGKGSRVVYHRTEFLSRERHSPVEEGHDSCIGTDAKGKAVAERVGSYAKIEVSNGIKEFHVRGKAESIDWRAVIEGRAPQLYLSQEFSSDLERFLTGGVTETIKGLWNRHRC